MGPGTLSSNGEREALKHKEEELLRVMRAVAAKASKGGKIKVEKTH